VAIHSGEFSSCTISVKTEEFRHDLFGLRYRVLAVTVTHAGKDLGYHHAVPIEGREEGEVVERAAGGARTFIANRLST
jgi:hypothetical protein